MRNCARTGSSSSPAELFAAGKFDQYRRDIPYATLIQAFKSLVRQILAQSDSAIADWRKSLQEHLAANGRLMIELVPELELVIGEQPPVARLPPRESQNRFHRVFQQLIQVFARPEHPLTLFLDDLQWLDPATLEFIEHLITHDEVQHLLLLGAYRDNEVGTSHPLMRMLARVHNTGVRIHQIALAPLRQDDVNQLVADSLRCAPERAQSLASDVLEKTGGNPFFIIQFMMELEEEGLLVLEPDAAVWAWDAGRIRAKGYTGNVVDLMVGKFNRVPEATKDALKQLACLGNSAEFVVLRLVDQGPSADMHEHLWEAVRAGLIFRTANAYEFVHDRVQEAAYSLIPEELRAPAHFRIGQLLAQHTPPARLEEAIFDIVSQLNRAPHLITSAGDCEQVAGLNLVAGQRANVIKMSQAVSGEIEFGKLIDMLMRTAIEHAGAQRGLLILPRGADYLIEAEATVGIDAVSVTVSQAELTGASLPESVFQYVVRTKESVLLHNAFGEGEFAVDDYIHRRHARSVLCLPLLKQTRLLGVLYLENSLATHVFTPARTAVLKLLASEAATSLENTRLYGELQEREVTVRRHLTESKRAEAKLRRSEAFLAEAQKVSLTGSFGWGVSDDHHVWSAETFRIFQFDPSTPVSFKLIRERVHPQDLPLMDQAIALAAEGKPLDFECRLLMPGGAVKYLHVVGHGLGDTVGLQEYVGAVQDITERRMSEETLGRVRSELAHVARITTLGALTASIAHEVRQPLSGIITNAGTCLRMLAAVPPDIEGARETARRTIRDGHRASEVITRLHAMFSKKDVALESMDLNEAAREVITLSKNELKRNHAVMRTEFVDDRLPIAGDRVQLQQVILNLLLNASYAMAGVGDRPREVVIRTEPAENGQVRLSVKDVGVGVHPDHVEQLFQPFYTTKPEGMGIGLSVSRSIIERHHGRMWAAPNDGPGATVSFLIPRQIPPAPPV